MTINIKIKEKIDELNMSIKNLLLKNNNDIDSINNDLTELSDKMEADKIELMEEMGEQIDTKLESSVEDIKKEIIDIAPFYWKKF